MTDCAWRLLRLLRRWATGSVHKFAQELSVEPPELLEAVSELQGLGLMVVYPMKDGVSSTNAMLEITQEGLDFIEKYDGQIDSET